MHLGADCNPFQKHQKANAIFVPTLFNVFWREALHTSGALVFWSSAPVFVAAARGMPLDCLAFVAGRAYIPESPWTMAIRGMALGRLPPPVHDSDSGLRHTPQPFCKESLFAFPGALV